MRVNGKKGKLYWCRIVLNSLMAFISLLNLVGIYLLISNPPHDVRVNEEVVTVVLSNSTRIIMILTTILAYGLMIYPLISLRRIISSIGGEEVFSINNVKRLTTSAIAMGIYILLNVFKLIDYEGQLSLMSFSRTMVAHNVNGGIPELTSTNFGLIFNLNTVYLIAIVIFIVVLIQIIKIGNDIREENALTI